MTHAHLQKESQDHDYRGAVRALAILLLQELIPQRRLRLEHGLILGQAQVRRSDLLEQVIVLAAFITPELRVLPGLATGAHLEGYIVNFQAIVRDTEEL